VQSIVELRHELDEVRAPIRQLVELLESMFETKKIEWAYDQMMFVVGDDKIPLSGLSSGERQLVLILLECMRAEGNTVMIDEPELSMHVDWQERLIPSIRTVNADAQLIMATHSPEIMANISERNIFEL
jgi:predicted ATPase